MFGAFEIGPDETVGLLLDLGDHVIVAFDDALFDFACAEGIDWIAGDDAVALVGGFGVEAGRSVAAAEDSAG